MMHFGHSTLACAPALVRGIRNQEKQDADNCKDG
jgi:hypothetical protein